jgi:hypothetical protein
MVLTFNQRIPVIGDKVTSVQYTVHETVKYGGCLEQQITCSIKFESKAFTVDTVAKNYFKDIANQIKPGEYSVEEYEIISKDKEY